MNAKVNWVVVADKSKARIYEVKKDNQKFSPIEVINNEFDPTALQNGHQPGSVSRSSGYGKKMLIAENSFQEKKIRDYIDSICQYIQKGRTENRFDKLILTADADLLGHVRESLDKNSQKSIFVSMDKDYAHFNDREVHDVLKENIRLSFFPA